MYKFFTILIISCTFLSFSKQAYEFLDKHHVTYAGDLGSDSNDPHTMIMAEIPQPLDLEEMRKVIVYLEESVRLDKETPYCMLRDMYEDLKMENIDITVTAKRALPMKINHAQLYMGTIQYRTIANTIYTEDFKEAYRIVTQTELK